MDSRAAPALRAERQSGRPSFTRTPTRVEASGLVIPAIRAERGRTCWQVEHDWCYDGPGWRLTIPCGWKTDLAAAPRPLRRRLNAFGFGITGPLLHDFLYEHGGRPPEGSCVPERRFTRREADALFLRLMREERVAWWRRAVAHRAARALGWTHWERPRRRAVACE